MKKIVILQNDFCVIGGIETFITNFCKTFYKNYEITIITNKIDNARALKLCEYADILTEIEDIECDSCIITSIFVNKNWLGHIKFKKLILMIHCDIKEMNRIWNKKFPLQIYDGKYVSVSETAKNSLKEEYDIDSIVIPNVLVENKEDVKILRLISACRLTEEKGYNRMKILCDLFEKYNIPYQWDVYTNSKKENYKNMIIREPQKDISILFKNYDYVVQLSDTESYCYTMYETMQKGVGVLVTPFPNAVEEIQNGINGYIIPFDMNVTQELINNIYNNIPKNKIYKQTGVIEKWKSILN